MLATDDLFHLERQLDDESFKDRTVVTNLNRLLEEIYDLPSYQQWLTGPSEFEFHYRLPRNFGSALPDQVRSLLDRYGLANGSSLVVKIDKHLGRLHLTDGPWIPPKRRVYPYSDESEIVCHYVMEKGYDRDADLLIDPASGCGHHGIGLQRISDRMFLDINLRALAYCRINSLLCGAEHMLSGLNDLRRGFPRGFNRLTARSCLLPVNMPFVIHPKGKNLPRTLAQDGGDRGVELTFAALKAIHGFAAEATGIERMRAVVLFYSLGSRAGSDWRWEVVEHAKSLFGRERVASLLLTEEKMWRVNGVKIESNPMDLDRLKLKATCHQTFSVTDEREAAEGYEAQENVFRNSGYTHLGYGVLDILAKGEL